MRLRDRRAACKPEVNIIPMIDIMFFLLVFFMMSTLYMVNIKTVDVNLPQAQHAETQMKVTYLVTMKADGSLWLEDKPIAEGQSAFCSAGACRPGHGLWLGYRLFGQDERGWRYTLCFGGGEREVLT